MFVLAGFAAADRFDGAHQGVLLVQPLTAVLAGTIPASGTLAVQVAAPPLLPGVVGAALHQQAVFGMGAAGALGPASNTVLVP